MDYFIYIAILAVLRTVRCEVYLTSKFFSKSITPHLFEWPDEVGDSYRYQASLLHSPDLPDWIQYVYSRRDRAGFIYGVPPRHHKDLEIEVIAFNQRTYDTARRVIHLAVQEKLSHATHQVQLKIDNLNVEDMLDVDRQDRLLNIFRNMLWKDSFIDLYITFMANAVSLGARKPLRPNESEGVVMRIGSIANFSSNLIELQEEVRPLWKLQSCDFKRTTVERWFRDEGFALDWCKFKLLTEELDDDSPKESILPELDFEKHNIWHPMKRSELPERSYSGEFALIILVPMLIMTLLVILLSIILCFQHEGMDQESEVFFQSIFNPCEDYARFVKK